MSFICLTSVYDTIPGSWVGLTVILGSVQVLCKRVWGVGVGRGVGGSLIKC